MKIKPGYRTSEFWVTLASFIFSGAYLFGLLESNNQKEDLISESSRGVEAVILIIGQLTVLFKYIKGRSEIKKIWWNTASEEERKEVNKPKPKPRKKKTTPKPKPKSKLL